MPMCMLLPGRSPTYPLPPPYTLLYSFTIPIHSLFTPLHSLCVLCCLSASSFHPVYDPRNVIGSNVLFRSFCFLFIARDGFQSTFMFFYLFYMFLDIFICLSNYLFYLFFFVFWKGVIGSSCCLFKVYIFSAVK